MTVCPKCGCDWEKWHHLTESGVNDHHCINCGNYSCYPPAGFKHKLSDLTEARNKAVLALERTKQSYENYIKRLDQKIATNVKDET